jgi:AcrR family transcriptional regulator
MSDGNRARGVSKAQWLERGLQALSEGGVSALTIERLAKSLGIARAGFYWHFKNRDDLLRQLLDYWTNELTAGITENPELDALPPKARLIKAMEMVHDHEMGRYDLAIRQWSLQDEEAARAVKTANRMRLDFFRKALSELGFVGDDLDMRAMLFAGYHSLEWAIFPEIPRKRRRELLPRRIELLTGRDRDEQVT